MIAMGVKVKFKVKFKVMVVTVVLAVVLHFLGPSVLLCA